MCLLKLGNDQANLTNDKTLSTLGVICSIGCACAIGGNLSGACLNPAVGFGLNMARYIITNDVNELNYLWINIIGPILGAYLANFFYKEIFVQFHENLKEKQFEIRSMY